MSAASIIASIITGGTNSHTTTSEEVNAYATDFVAQGVLGAFTNTNGAAPCTGSFGVNADSSPDMAITIKGSGNTGNGQAIAYILGQPTSQATQMIRARMASDSTEYTINPNSSGSTKWDWIYLQFSPTNAANPDLAGDNVIAIYTSRSTSSSTDTNAPPTYGILLAVVTVANGASSITNANISDRRTQTTLNIGSTNNSNGWSTLNYPLSYSANNGNKEFQVTTPNDLTGILWPGNKIRLTRSVTPPTQCMGFVSSSSQYASLASPTGLTFASAFTCEAWVYLNSYTNAAQSIIGRRNGSGGGAFMLGVTASGQPQVYYGDVTTDFTTIISYQSIPLNQWVHLAGVVSSVSGKTGAVYINGTLASTFLGSSGASVLTQAGSLEVGGWAGANELLNGYVSEARVWSAAQSQANIQANMAISVAGNATNLVALFQGNGNFTDGTTNANNLTATNGAIATQAANPYNATEYAVVNAISYSNPTTTITLDTGVNCTIPNMTLASPYYSISESPYGIAPGLETNRLLAYIPALTNFTTASTTAVQLGGMIATVNVPSGSRVRIRCLISNGSVNTNNRAIALSVWDGAVGSGVQIAQSQLYMPVAGTGNNCIAEVIVRPVSGSKTYSIGLSIAGGAGTVGTNSALTNADFMSIETIS